MEQNEKKELRSLNVELPTLYVEELEQRLETDPLAIGGLLSGGFDGVDTYAGISCDEFTCDVYCPSDCSDHCGDFHCRNFR
ncbi:hypothetical protein [Bacteroides caecimuris]|uniref:hypothetical protein n=1 Tax=Bacteroides caecimuris TaxID=1796613 RepID=UPI001C3D943E|nr:hypothetical protein [Bacteroides caecimuris]